MPSCLCYTGHLKNLSAPLLGDRMAGTPPAGLTGRPQDVRLKGSSSNTGLSSLSAPPPQSGHCNRAGRRTRSPPDYPHQALYRPITSGARSVSSLRDRRPLLLNLLVWRTVINNLVLVSCLRVLTVLGIPQTPSFYCSRSWYPEFYQDPEQTLIYYRNYCEHTL